MYILQEIEAMRKRVLQEINTEFDIRSLFSLVVCLKYQIKLILLRRFALFYQRDLL